MSTFKGIVAEFPQIRIDYFRHQPEQKAPLACFLSHVHSDHLTGLESLRAPFVYCSAATREILLRLEKHFFRINYARGILESRNVTYANNLARLAKPLPLETPTEIELSPGNKIRVTLFDANHCIGAVMFLIEGRGKAILYTGDIRAETWWVNSLVRNPILLPYAVGSRRLDCIYLDTTFATKSEPYREFPSKAEGIRELLENVEKYPKDTVFYFHSWTFGYEDVWVALSAFLESRIHLDEYRARLYSSLTPLKNKFLRNNLLAIPEASALCGFKNGNHIQPGCLTSEADVRLHSCERGMGCPVIDRDENAKIVHIIPIINRHNGAELAELGAGGGKGDLNQKEELEMNGDVSKLMELCAKQIENPELLSKVLKLIEDLFDKETGQIDLRLTTKKETPDNEEELSLKTLVSVLTNHAGKTEDEAPRNRAIKFPYSRHSSYSELCILVDAFKPKDVYPCTVDDDDWTPALSTRNLFSHYCSADANVYRHDTDMLQMYEARLERERSGKRNLEAQTSDHVDSLEPITPKKPRTIEQVAGEESITEEFLTPEGSRSLAMNGETRQSNKDVVANSSPIVQRPPEAEPSPLRPNGREQVIEEPPPSTTPISGLQSDDEAMLRSTAVTPGEPINMPRSSLSSATSSTTSSTTSSEKSTKRLSNKRLAYNAVLGLGLTWAEFGGLECTKSAKDREETEL